MPATLMTLRIDEKSPLTARASMLKRHELLRQNWHKMMYAERRAMQKELRKEAPKRTGAFAKGIRGLAFEDPATSRLTLEFTVSGEHAYLLPWIVSGTRPHLIPLGGSAEMLFKGYPLRFWWEKGPRGPDIYRFWHVHHPGTKPDDFGGRAFATRRPHMVKNLHELGASVASLSRYTGEPW